MMLVLLIGLFMNAISGDIHSDISRIQKAHQPDIPLSFKINYKYYDNENLKQAKDSLTGELTIWKKNFIYDIGESTFFRNDNYYLVISRISKSITIMEPPSDASGALPMNLIDSLIGAKRLKSEVLSEDQKFRTYSLTYREGIIDHVNITFYLASGWIDNIIVYYKKEIKLRDDLKNSAVLKISFSGYHYLKGAPDLMSEKKYITKSKNEFNPSEKYKGYTIKNNLKH